jgi:hypothetical protein
VLEDTGDDIPKAERDTDIVLHLCTKAKTEGTGTAGRVESISPRGVWEERARTQTRLRQSLHRDLKMIAQRGRGIATCRQKAARQLPRSLNQPL